MGSRRMWRSMIQWSDLYRAANDSEMDDPYSEDESDDDASLYSSNDLYAEFHWLEAIDGFVSHTSSTSSPRHIGRCHAKLIRRNKVSRDFHAAMGEPSEETSSLAFDLFDRYARLKQELIEHPIKKGSGVWGKELNSGDILLIELLSIEKYFRGHGHGRRLVEKLLDEVRQKTKSFVAMAWPASLTTEVEAELGDRPEEESKPIHEAHKIASKSFFRPLGFRRIGLSRWFAFTDTPDHPSHRIPATDDCELPEPPARIPLSTIDPDIEKLWELENADGIEYLNRTLRDVTLDDSRWQSADKNGNTLLHLAASKSNPAVVKWLMNRAAFLAGQRNNEGYTPEEAILVQMEKNQNYLAVYAAYFPVRRCSKPRACCAPWPYRRPRPRTGVHAACHPSFGSFFWFQRSSSRMRPALERQRERDGDRVLTRCLWLLLWTVHRRVSEPTNELCLKMRGRTDL